MFLSEIHQAKTQPIILFDLNSLHINQTEFIKVFSPTFDFLTWDDYDLKNEQIQFLNKHFPQHQQTLAEFLDVNQFINQLKPNLKTEFKKIRPYRKRAIATFKITKNENWEIKRIPTGVFKQESNKFNPQPRIFSEIKDEVCSHPLFTQLLFSLTALIEKYKPETKSIKVHCHQVSTFASFDLKGKNSPEGIHKDGADFIVSALVVGKKNVTGGESRVFDSDKKTILFQHSLESGEGIFMADDPSPYFHDVTPISLKDVSLKTGFRNLFGFDFKIDHIF